MTEQTTPELAPKPFVFYESQVYRMMLYSHGRSPRLALFRKRTKDVVEFQDGDVCRLVQQLERFDSGDPREDQVYVDQYLDTFHFQATGMIQ